MGSRPSSEEQAADRRFDPISANSDQLYQSLEQQPPLPPQINPQQQQSQVSTYPAMHQRSATFAHPSHAAQQQFESQRSASLVQYPSNVPQQPVVYQQQPFMYPQQQQPVFYPSAFHQPHMQPIPQHQLTQHNFYNPPYQQPYFQPPMFQQSFQPGTVVQVGMSSNQLLAGFSPYGMHVPSVQQPVMQQENVARIKNDLILKKESLRLIMAPESSFGSLSFSFDAHAACKICVYFCASEVSSGALPCFEENVQVRPNGPRTYHFPKGVNQQFELTANDFFDFSGLLPIQLQHIPPSTYFPLVIALHRIPEVGCEAGSHVDAIVTYAAFSGNTDVSKSVHILQQKAHIGQVAFTLQELYGMDLSKDASESSTCIVCLSEPRTTTTYPCRHFVLCADCAAAIRVKSNPCPVCRSRIERFQTLNVNEPADKKLM